MTTTLDGATLFFNTSSITDLSTIYSEGLTKRDFIIFRRGISPLSLKRCENGPIDSVLTRTVTEVKSLCSAKNAHPHCHIVFSRVDYDGKILTQTTNFKKNERVCKTINLKHRLTQGKSKLNTYVSKLRGKDPKLH